MYLVKKKYLYVLTAFIIILVIFGEVRFFHAIKSANLTADLQIKYEVENFIFAAIVLIIVIFLFLVNFIRTSRNVLKKLDKMIEISEYGKLDVSSQLKEMGKLGDRVNYLLFYLNQLNDKKTLKISSLSRIQGYLMKKINESLLVLDSKGQILDCSEQFLKVFREDKEDLLEKDIEQLFGDIFIEPLFAEAREKKKPLIREDLVMREGGRERKHRVVFHPIINADNEVSHLICVIER